MRNERGKRVAEKTKFIEAAPILVHNFELPLHPAGGIPGGQSPTGPLNLIRDMNRRLLAAVAPIGQTFVVDVEHLLGQVGYENGVTVNNVLPGYTRTQRLDQILADRSKAAGKPEDEIAKAMLSNVPAGRFAEAHEIAGVIAFLCTPAAAYVNGQSLAVDGGRMQSI